MLAAPFVLPAGASVVTFDNSDGRFVWQFSWRAGTYSNLFDPTLGPAQQDAAHPAGSYRYLADDPCCSDVMVSDFIAGGARAMTARVSDPVNIDNPCFFTSDPRADFDGSGTVDSHELFAFLDSFFIGC